MTRPPSDHGPTPPGQRPPGTPQPQGNPAYPAPPQGFPAVPRQRPPGRPVPPPGYPQRPGYPQQPGAAVPPPGYPQRQGFPPPPGYGQPPYGQAAPGYRAPMPPPAAAPPTGGFPAARPTPPRRGRVGALLVILILVVTGVLLRTAITTGLHTINAGSTVKTTYSGDAGENRGVAATADNPLLTNPDYTLLPAKCAYTQWGTQVDVARKFFQTAADCLYSAWKPLFDKMNLPFEQPKLNVSATTSGITTLCTGNSSNFAAFYCSADMTIYMPISQLQTDLFGNNWVVYLSVFAHEYGHHVQAQAGILGKVHSQRRDAGARSDLGLELSRRTEQQAQCFDGMYLSSSSNGGSLSSAQIGVAKNDAYHRGDAPGDMRDHGTAQNMGDWFVIGYDKDRAMACNTFSVPASKVN
ncbi:neutral zinc metallopeptidase [Nocardia sp. CDC153]|uniref:neutral zinc metallopeptidase n=1 Tax=Nocardia sp. CDC153 TaxID=3112167 RepID=UPI002DBDD281|nr:neutral zinc metallopeptidase [Nocardia sp. CDC153]MEC3955663.1 neutral zinc metallopeptidase [Nocardia sp. CDC153]